MKTRTLHVAVEPKMMADLEAIATRRDVSLSALIRRILARYINDSKKG